jgi:cytoskeleton protein RodZ
MIDAPGKTLRKERETRNISLEEISKYSKVKKHHLRALEEDRYDLLPPAIYVKGYLNIYAKYLALDPKTIVLQYENYLKSLLPPAPLEIQQQASSKKSARPRFLLSLFFTTIFFFKVFK